MPGASQGRLQDIQVFGRQAVEELCRDRFPACLAGFFQDKSEILLDLQRRRQLSGQALDRRIGQNSARSLGFRALLQQPLDVGPLLFRKRYQDSEEAA